MADWKKWVAVNKDKLSLDDFVEDIISEISFNEGARIAEEETINKACEWLMVHVNDNLEYGSRVVVRNFREYMKGGSDD